jgi:Mce-associated membrane protein
VEDQQPAAGDLTENDDRDGMTEPDRDDEAPDGPSTDTDQAAESHADVSAGKATGTRVTAFVVAAVILLVASAAFAGGSLKPWLSDRATVVIKLRVAQTAANAITAVWSYTPENIDALADRAATYLSGDFQAQYRKFVDAIVAPNKQAKITSSTELTGAAVESLDIPNAVAMAYTNTTSTSPLTKNIPSLKYLSYRLGLTRVDGRWLVTQMMTLTSLDLTPHP